MPDCSNLITELDDLAVSLLGGTPMLSTLCLLSLEEKISRYFNGVAKTNMISGHKANV